MAYRVTADIEYLDGVLAGLLIPAGYTAPFPTYRSAQRCAAWLCKVQNDNDFVRACVTGHRYAIRGHVSIDRVEPTNYRAAVHMIDGGS